jgi:hypothetical protein
LKIPRSGTESTPSSITAIRGRGIPGSPCFLICLPSVDFPAPGCPVRQRIARSLSCSASKQAEDRFFAQSDFDKDSGTASGSLIEWIKGIENQTSGLGNRETIF